MQRSVPAAAWLAKIFLLRFARIHRDPLALPLLGLALLGGSGASLHGYIDPAPPAWLFAVLAGSYALIFALPCAADRMIARRLNGAARTLVFPAAVTTLDWLMQWHPFLTGIWGITFLVAWGASATNAVWEGGWSRRALLAHGGPFAVALSVALLYGGARLAAPLAGPTAQVAALAPSRELWSYPPVREIATAASEERQTFSERAARAVDDLFARTSQAAAAASQIVVWAETRPPLLCRGRRHHPARRRDCVHLAAELGCRAEVAEGRSDRPAVADVTRQGGTLPQQELGLGGTRASQGAQLTPLAP